MYSPIPQFRHAVSTLTSLILVQMLFSVWIITVSGLPYPCTLTNFVTAMDLYRTLRPCTTFGTPSSITCYNCPLDFLSRHPTLQSETRSERIR